LWFTCIHLHITYIATLGFKNQVGFDAIPVWVNGHTYFENGLVLPCHHALISHFHVQWAGHALLSYVKLCWSTCYSQGEYCNSVSYLSWYLQPTNIAGCLVG
jgi:hypothetical protein